MNHETAIKRIQELVQSVMALEFGCKVLNKDLNKVLTVTYLSSYNECIHCFYEWESDSTWIWKKYLENSFEILGKPITLAVILSAIDDESLVIEAKTGQFGTTTAEGVYVGEHAIWNLSKDNFNDQSDETKTFIGELLK